MADEQAFDLDKIRELITLMDEHGLSEISLSQGDQAAPRSKWEMVCQSSEWILSRSRCTLAWVKRSHMG